MRRARCRAVAGRQKVNPSSLCAQSPVAAARAQIKHRHVQQGHRRGVGKGGATAGFRSRALAKLQLHVQAAPEADPAASKACKPLCAACPVCGATRCGLRLQGRLMQLREIVGSLRATSRGAAPALPLSGGGALVASSCVLGVRVACYSTPMESLLAGPYRSLLLLIMRMLPWLCFDACRAGRPSRQGRPRFRCAGCCLLGLAQPQHVLDCQGISHVRLLITFGGAFVWLWHDQLPLGSAVPTMPGRPICSAARGQLSPPCRSCCRQLQSSKAFVHRKMPGDRLTSQASWLAVSGQACTAQPGGRKQRC